jgi:hypothetical protein
MFGVNTSIPPPPIINVPRRVSPPTLVENTNPDVSFYFNLALFISSQFLFISISSAILSSYISIL